MQTLILAGAVVALAVALRELRRAAELAELRAGWVVTEVGRTALAGSHASRRTHPKRTAGELLVIAARELVDACTLRDLNGPAWAARARHLARTVQATESRRRRYQRAQPARVERMPDVVTFDPEALPAVAS